MSSVSSGDVTLLSRSQRHKRFPNYTLTALFSCFTHWRCVAASIDAVHTLTHSHSLTLSNLQTFTLRMNTHSHTQKIYMKHLRIFDDVREFDTHLNVCVFEYE